MPFGYVAGRPEERAGATAVYNKARERGLGTEIPTEWFLQDIRD